MGETWSETMLERSRSAITESRYLSLNGKIVFKNIDGSRHFVYEAEMDKSLYRLRCMKNSHTFLHFDSVDDLFHAGWILA
ncbi:MAG: hypothetical protein Q9M22_02300 [Mariprofundaceae bacterium]|nr:hypothetical protein [Mariprofundaceae bacterium]